ncbi:hypothetical protein E6A51_06120 [Brachyspira hampsonii]|nr:hypothetical protein [Brachyspira hampsonii]MBW5389763.1 hypothetical protein [Brachyspira hampsonii]MBW5395876.1 hypothetical protein [Brachyspira hampsonii]OEJ20426.1 hypothetical protein A9495_12050 [Brachyspira hampsonii]
MAGSFEIDVLQKNAVSEEIQSIFNEATNMQGVRRELMLYLGRQLVHGYNYAYISRSEIVVPDSVAYYELIIVNVTYDNESRKINDLKATTIIKNAEKGMFGGITCSKSDEAIIRIIDSVYANELISLFNIAVGNTKNIKEGTEEEMELVKKVKEYDYEVELYLGDKPVTGIDYYYIAKVQNIETKVKGIQLVTVNNPPSGTKVVEIKDIL